MTRQERISIARLFRDLINADSIIAAGEMEYYSSVRERYSLHKEDEMAAMDMTLGKAIAIISKMSPLAKKRLYGYCGEMTMSDGFCDRTEALLMVAAHYGFGLDGNDTASVVSVPKQFPSIEDATIVYVETCWDEVSNQEITESYRTIMHELRLVGFEFVYIPSVVKHIRDTSSNLMTQVLGFISPQRDEAAIMALRQELTRITTEEFTQDVLCNKLGMEGLRSGCSSLLIKVGEDYVAGKRYANYLRLHIERDVSDVVIDFVDLFSSMQWNATVGCAAPLVKEGHFLYYGFYKMLLDIYAERTQIQSRIVLDFVRGEIVLPDIYSSLSGLHRKEKAFYALLLVESENGGVCFTQPKTKEEVFLYEKNMQIIQKKYSYIYSMLGGESEKAPKIENSSIRMPIMACIKKSINGLSSKLYQVQNYLVTKGENGQLYVPLPVGLVEFKDFCHPDNTPISKFRYPK